MGGLKSRAINDNSHWPLNSRHQRQHAHAMIDPSVRARVGSPAEFFSSLASDRDIATRLSQSYVGGEKKPFNYGRESKPPPVLGAHTCHEQQTNNSLTLVRGVGPTCGLKEKKTCPRGHPRKIVSAPSRAINPAMAHSRTVTNRQQLGYLESIEGRKGVFIFSLPTITHRPIVGLPLLPHRVAS